MLPLLCLLCAPPPPDATFASDLVARSSIVVTFAPPEPSPPPIRIQGSSDRPFQLRAQAGIITKVRGTGVAGGIGVYRRLENPPQIEVLGDVNIGTLYGGFLMAFSGNALYHLTLENAPVNPYIGGGIVVAFLKESGFSDTYAGVQIIAGVPLPTEGSREIRIEGRMLFVFGHPFVIGASFSF